MLGHVSAARRRLFATASLLLSSVCLAACAVVFGFEDLSDRGPDAATSVDAPSTPTPDTGSAQPCQPYLPSGPDVAGGDPRYFAFSTLSVVVDKNDPEGTNLDCKTTAYRPDSLEVDPSTSSCKVVAPGSEAMLDGVGGIDNSAGSFSRIPSFDFQRLNRQYESGIASIVLSLIAAEPTLRNDGSVTVVAEPASNRDLPGGSDCGAWPVDDAGLRKPARGDKWCRDERKGKQTAQTAWISEGKLFAYFLALSIPSAPAEQPEEGSSIYRLSYIELSNVWLTAHVDQVAGGTDLVLSNGRIAGRWTTKALFDLFATQLSCEGKPLDDPATLTGRQQLCASVRDIGTTDDPNQTCNAISTLLSFAGYQLDDTGSGNPNIPHYVDCGGGTIPDCGEPVPDGGGDFSEDLDGSADADSDADGDAADAAETSSSGGECDGAQQAACVQ